MKKNKKTYFLKIFWKKRHTVYTNYGMPKYNLSIFYLVYIVT